MANPDPLRLAILTELRQAAGLTLSVMARRCGLRGRQSHQTAGAWERGEMVPNEGRRRAHLLGYLWDDLGLRSDPTRFEDVWDLLVEEWGWESIGDREWDRLTTQPRPQRGGETAGTSAAQPVGAKRVPFQAPAVTPHFVGRIALQQQVIKRLTAPNEPRRVALVGMGGIGKTTVATHISHQLRTQFPDGLLWAQTAISTPLDILQSWAAAFGYDFSGLSDVESRSAALRDLLADKAILVVLDNVERVSPVRPLLVQGKAGALLLTTRDLDVAHAIHAEPQQVNELSAADSRDFFVQMLGAQRVDAALDACDEIGTVLQHLPLAIEIVAQRLRSRGRMPLQQMVVQLQDQQQRLGLGISDLAVRASFETSWRALDAEQQRIFTLLALFAGRLFAVEALTHIAALDQAAVEEHLYALTALSLVKEEGEIHYQQHPLLADFAREKLGSAPTAHNRFSNYYYRFVQEDAERAQLQPEWGNIAAAIEMAHHQQRWQLVLDFTDTLAPIWLSHSRYDNACAAYAMARAAAEQLDDEARLAKTLVRWGVVAIEQSQYPRAKALLTEALQLWMTLEEDAGVAEAYFNLARIAIDCGEHGEAETLLTECLALHELLQDQAGIAATQYYQARVCFIHGDLAAAKALLLAALAIQERVEENRALLPTLRLLAQVAAREEDFALAHGYCQQAEALCTALGDEAELATVHYTATILERRRGNAAAAQHHAEQALDRFQRLGLQRLEGMVRYQLGAVLHEDGQYTVALPHVQQSIRIFDTVQNPLGKLYALVLLGDLYAALEQKEDGQQLWQQAAVLATEQENEAVRAQVAGRLQQVLSHTP